MSQMFDTFTNRYTVRGSLVFDAGFHVGGSSGGFDPLSCDKSVLRDSVGRAYIPGSSLKGVFRSRVESLVRALTSGKPEWCCDPMTSPCLEAETVKRIREEMRGLDRSEHDLYWVREIEKRTCRICGVFGHGYLASHVWVQDAHPGKDSLTPRTEVRDGVAIDRDSETASGGRKFDYELVNRGVDFPFVLRAENVDKISLGLVCLGLREFSTGSCALGGMKSRGLGSFRLVIDSIETVSGPDELLAYLRTGRGVVLEGPALERFISDGLARLGDEIGTADSAK